MALRNIIAWVDPEHQLLRYVERYKYFVIWQGTWCWWPSMLFHKHLAWELLIYMQSYHEHLKLKLVHLWTTITRAFYSEIYVAFHKLKNFMSILHGSLCITHFVGIWHWNMYIFISFYTGGYIYTLEFHCHYTQKRIITYHFTNTTHCMVDSSSSSQSVIICKTALQS